MNWLDGALTLWHMLCHTQEEWPEDEEARREIRKDFSSDPSVGDR